MGQATGEPGAGRLTIRELASGLEDASLRRQIENAASEAIAKNTQQVAHA
jgi:hypothetical protein